MKPEERLKDVTELMEPIIEDTTVPKNIRIKITKAKEEVLKKEGDRALNIMNAIYLIEEVSNDINMPFHIRTELWSILSELEAVKEELK